MRTRSPLVAAFDEDSGALHRRRTPPRRQRRPRTRTRCAADAADDGAASTFIAVAFPDNQVQILPYNRTVKDLGGPSAGAVSRALRERFHVAPDGADRRRGKGEVAMYLAGKWYAIDLTGAEPATARAPACLDVALLQRPCSSSC